MNTESWPRVSVQPRGPFLSPIPASYWALQTNVRLLLDTKLRRMHVTVGSRIFYHRVSRCPAGLHGNFSGSRRDRQDPILSISDFVFSNAHGPLAASFMNSCALRREAIG